MLAAGGKQFQDWSATYRLFERDRIAQKELFAPAIKSVLENLDEEAPLFAMMDDTLIRKRGRKVAGTAWKRDPLGPAFHTNFVWGQRYLQVSVALPDLDVEGRARGIPIKFKHAPSPVKPNRHAPPEDWMTFRAQKKVSKISTVGATCLGDLREQIPKRKIVCAVDGSFTNQEVFRSMPKDTILIGRIRKDASLFQVPEEMTGVMRGRKKYYGDRLPTPEEVRQDESIPWQTVRAFAAGKWHEFKLKTMPTVRWKSSGDHDMRIVIIQPLAYRPRKGAKLLYRQPGYLICSDPYFPLDQLLQAYLWRWEIELNFRDEKTIMGAGDAQVRTMSAVQSVPAFVVASYAYMLLAAHAVKVKTNSIPSPKWHSRNLSNRCSTQKILSIFRSQYWGLEMEPNKSGFVSNSFESKSRFYSSDSLDSAVCYAFK